LTKHDLNNIGKLILYRLLENNIFFTTHFTNENIGKKFTSFRPCWWLPTGVVGLYLAADDWAA
jgi:hypothetical protein